MTERAHTHDVRVDRERGVVVKRFRACRGDEPAREWAALTLLARFAPGLAPLPLSAELDTDAPVITMSWLPGTPLGPAPVTPVQADALAEALGRLWRSVPSVQHKFPGGVTPISVILAHRVREMLAAEPDLGQAPVVMRAHAGAVAWLYGGSLARHRLAGHDTVLGHGDPNLDNFLWDGHRIRLIDFEDSGPSDRALELANLAEHISAWSCASLDADDFLARFALTGAEQARVRDFRRLAALFWLLLLRPGGSASARNPAGTLERQAERLLGLLG